MYALAGGYEREEVRPGCAYALLARRCMYLWNFVPESTVASALPTILGMPGPSSCDAYAVLVSPQLLDLDLYARQMLASSQASSPLVTYS